MFILFYSYLPFKKKKTVVYAYIRTKLSKLLIDARILTITVKYSISLWYIIMIYYNNAVRSIFTLLFSIKI